MRPSRFLSGFRPVFTALLIFLTLNFSFFAVLFLYPSLLDWLWLSADRPWGILTSVFSHVDLEHIFSNVAGFIFASALFILINLRKSRQTRHRLSRRFLLLAFLAGIGANVLEYPFLLTSLKSAYGASGVVYGALGIVLSCAIQDLPDNFRFLMRGRQRLAGRRRKRVLRFSAIGVKFYSSLMSLSLVISLLILVVLDVSSFLSVAPGVDVFAHGVGFLIGFLSFGALRILDRKYRRHLSNSNGPRFFGSIL
ncbi:MAG: rhomboid family intramembrane serine protease [Candidatus Hadarchaeum sp.]|uniref:rhomboid family intramembrane serine protease n=1 Tax=Candidatus Hadarchaeum sp. TaxID=2883567 RepID=UPI003D0CD9D5